MRGETDETRTGAVIETGEAVTEMTGGLVADGKTTERGEEEGGSVMTTEGAGGSPDGGETRRDETGTRLTGQAGRRSTTGCRAWPA